MIKRHVVNCVTKQVTVLETSGPLRPIGNGTPAKEIAVARRAQLALEKQELQLVTDAAYLERVVGILTSAISGSPQNNENSERGQAPVRQALLAFLIASKAINVTQAKKMGWIPISTDVEST